MHQNRLKTHIWLRSEFRSESGIFFWSICTDRELQSSTEHPIHAKFDDFLNFEGKIWEKYWKNAPKCEIFARIFVHILTNYFFCSSACPQGPFFSEKLLLLSVRMPAGAFFSEKLRFCAVSVPAGAFFYQKWHIFCTWLKPPYMNLSIYD